MGVTDCSKLSLKECESAILSMQIKEGQTKVSKRILASETMQKMIKIAEDFIKNNDVICYGGTAINNILPKDAQFYDRTVDMADYDFFTTNALEDAKELADIYHKNGLTDVEAKSGVHVGTYKVFVNYIPVADITDLAKPIFRTMKKDALRVNGILYSRVLLLISILYALVLWIL